MFLSLFKMNNQGLKILRETRSEVARFENIKKNFYDEQEKFTKIDQINIIFEFQAWMSEEIVEATNRFSDKINSSCSDGPRFATKAGQIANLTNQLRQVLRDVDISAEKFDKNGKSDFRRCPYCGKIWQKKECSEQDTKCGENVKSNESNIGKMANFYFLWDETTEKLVVNKIAQKKTRRQENQPDYSGTAENYKGCGKKITWRKMAPVEDFESSITKCPKPTSKEPKQISPKQSTISSSFFNGKFKLHKS